MLVMIDNRLYGSSIHPPPPSSSSVKEPSSPITYFPILPFPLSAPSPPLPPKLPFPFCAGSKSPRASSGACNSGAAAWSLGKGRLGNDQPFEAGGTTSGNRRVYFELLSALTGCRLTIRLDLC